MSDPALDSVCAKLAVVQRQLEIAELRCCRSRAMALGVIARVEADERLKLPPAKTDVNPALALIQVKLEAELDTARRILLAMDEP